MLERISHEPGGWHSRHGVPVSIESAAHTVLVDSRRGSLDVASIDADRWRSEKSQPFRIEVVTNLDLHKFDRHAALRSNIAHELDRPVMPRAPGEIQNLDNGHATASHTRRLDGATACVLRVLGGVIHLDSRRRRRPSSPFLSAAQRLPR
jgi:hypothetical protein